MVPASKAWRRARSASRFFATTTAPVVSLSIRCTRRGRKLSPPSPASSRSSTMCSRAPARDPSSRIHRSGSTARLWGLLTISTSSSSWRTGISTPGATGRFGARSQSIVAITTWLGRRRLPGTTSIPSRRMLPAAISCRRKPFERPGYCRQRNSSSSSPARSPATTNVSMASARRWEGRIRAAGGRVDLGLEDARRRAGSCSGQRSRARSRPRRGRRPHGPGSPGRGRRYGGSACRGRRTFRPPPLPARGTRP